MAYLECQGRAVEVQVKERFRNPGCRGDRLSFIAAVEIEEDCSRQASGFVCDGERNKRKPIRLRPPDAVRRDMSSSFVERSGRGLGAHGMLAYKVTPVYLTSFFGVFAVCRVGDGTRCSPEGVFVIVKVSVLVPVMVCIGGYPPELEISGDRVSMSDSAIWHSSVSGELRNKDDYK